MSNNLFQEIPEDEIELGKDEILVPVAHFNKVKRVSFFPLYFKNVDLFKSLMSPTQPFWIFFFYVIFSFRQEIYQTFGTPFLIRITDVSTIVFCS